MNIKEFLRDAYVKITLYFDLGMSQFQRVLGLLALVTLAGVYRSTLDYYQIPLFGFIIFTITCVVIGAIIIGIFYIRFGMYGKSTGMQSGLNPEWIETRDNIKEIRRILDGDRSSKEKVMALYDIHPSVFWGFGTLISGNGSIHIGEGTYIGRNSFITSEPETATIRIGSGCSIGHNVHIRTQVHVHIFDFDEEKAAPIEGKDIAIADKVWIGANVYVSGGVKIGTNSIVGANSVVTHDIPANEIWGGNPAVFIRNKEEYKNG